MSNKMLKTFCRSNYFKGTQFPGSTTFSTSGWSQLGLSNMILSLDCLVLLTSFVRDLFNDSLLSLSIYLNFLNYYFRVEKTFPKMFLLLQNTLHTPSFIKSWFFPQLKAYLFQGGKFFPKMFLLLQNTLNSPSFIKSWFFFLQLKAYL